VNAAGNLRLPDPMLSRPGTLPLGSGYGYEVKWDGFRAIVSTVAGLQVRSRRGWTMTDRLASSPNCRRGWFSTANGSHWESTGSRACRASSERVLYGHDGIAVTFVIFDVLVRRRRSTMHLP
jgi:hypothetical protein